MPQLEIIENGTSLNPDTMGDPIYQIGTKNAEGGYDIVVFDAMTDQEAKAKLQELQPVKAAAAPKAAPAPKVAPAPKKEPDVKKKVAIKQAPAKKKVSAKKKVPAKKKR
jgi:IS5 family transposase